MSAEITDISALKTVARLTAFARAASLFVGAVWLFHGLVNKLLAGSLALSEFGLRQHAERVEGMRHLAIVQAVPGLGGATGERVLVVVGVMEVAIAVWVLTAWMPRACAAVQTVLLLSMNVLELTFARHLLLWPAALIPVNLSFLALAWTAAILRQPVRLRARLRRHPIPIDAHFDDCLTLTYAVPADVLRPLVPPGLQLETLRGYGFIAVALVQTESLRPAWLPRVFGRNFFLAGYRVFVRMQAPDGRILRGLHILRSDANSALMVSAGNLLTHYNYRRCEAAIRSSNGRIDIAVRTADSSGDLDMTATLDDAVLPVESPFSSLREARRFAGPLPFTFDYEPETHAIVAIQATRTNWAPRPIGVDVRRISFFGQPMFRGSTPTLAAAFHVGGVDYRWERGVRIPLAAARGVAA